MRKLHIYWFLGTAVFFPLVGGGALDGGADGGLAVQILASEMIIL